MKTDPTLFSHCSQAQASLNNILSKNLRTKHHSKTNESVKSTNINFSELEKDFLLVQSIPCSYKKQTFSI